MSYESKRQKRKRQRAARKAAKRRKREAERKAKAVHDERMARFRFVRDWLTARLRAIWRLLGLAGLVIGLYQARPSVEVAAHRSDNPHNPYRHRFSVENDGILFDLVDVDVSCEAVSVESGDVFECTESDGPQDIELKRGKSQSIDCIKLNYPEPMTAVKFDAHIVTRFSAAVWPGLRFEDITRFVGRGYASGSIDVEEQPADMVKLGRCRDLQAVAARRRGESIR